MPADKKPRAPATPRRSVRPTITSVAVVVSDRRRSQAWYTDSLGLDLIDSQDHWVTVGRKGEPAVLHLCQVTEFDPSGALEPGNTGILLRLPGRDFEARCASLKSRGVPFAHEPEKAEWGWWAVVRDPDGNELMLAP